MEKGKLTWSEFMTKVEQYARYLCERKGEDPDSYYEEFNREAAIWGQPDEYVFPKVYAWKEYEDEAYVAVAFFFGEPSE